jgi:hypothetical protein
MTPHHMMGSAYEPMKLLGQNFETLNSIDVTLNQSILF